MQLPSQGIQNSTVPGPATERLLTLQVNESTTPHQNEPIKREQRRWDGPSTSLQPHSLLTAGLAPAKGDWSFTQPRLGHPKAGAPPPRWGPAPGLHRPPGERAYPNAQPDPAAQPVASLPLGLARGTPEKPMALCSL